MRRSVSLCLTFLALALAPLAAAAEEPKAIIEKAIKAHGAKEAVAGEGMSYKSKGQVFVQGLEIGFSGKSVRLFPDRMRQDIEAEVNGNAMKMTVAYSPKGGWMEMNGAAQDMPETQLTSMKHEMHAARCCQLTPLLKEPFKLEALPAAEVEGKKAVGVKAVAKDQPDVSLWFDADSGMLVKAAYKTIDPNQGSEITQEMFFKDYKDFGGQKMFTKLLVKREGEKYLDLEASDYKKEPKVDEKLFDKP